MRIVIVIGLTVAGALAAYAQEQIVDIKFRLYRSIEAGEPTPDVDRDADDPTPDIAAQEPTTGLIEGSLDETSADVNGFYKEGNQLIWRMPNGGTERRYELVSAPSVRTFVDKEASIKIGGQLPEYFEPDPKEEGRFIHRVRDKRPGTSVGVTVHERTNDSAQLQTYGEIITINERKKLPGVGLDIGEPLLQTVKWENDMIVPYGTWSFQRVGLHNRHEFLCFARVTRAPAESEATPTAQYSIETKLMRLPPSVAETVREQFVYDDSVECEGDEARVFRVLLPGTNANAEVREFLSPMNSDEGVELLTAPRVTLGFSQRKKIVLSVPRVTLGFSQRKKNVVQRNETKGQSLIRGGWTNPNTSSTVTDVFTSFSPMFADFFAMEKPYLGVIGDVVTYRDSEDDSILGLDGYLIGVQVNPPVIGGDDKIGIDMFFDHQYKTGGRESGFLRRAEPYTFGNQAFRFSDIRVEDGGWFGIEFESKQTGDVTLLLVEVRKVIHGPAKTFNAESSVTPKREPQPAPPQTNMFSSLTIPDDVQVILDIVPHIDGNNVQLRTSLFAVRDEPERSLLWADVGIADGEEAVFGYAVDGADMHSRLLGIASRDRHSQSVSDTPATAFPGTVVPDDADYLLGVLPKIEGENVRLWVRLIHKEDRGKRAADHGVWTNVIVHSGGSLTLGHCGDGGVKFLGIRSPVTLAP